MKKNLPGNSDFGFYVVSSLCAVFLVALTLFSALEGIHAEKIERKLIAGLSSSDLEESVESFETLSGMFFHQTAPGLRSSLTHGITAGIHKSQREFRFTAAISKLRLLGRTGGRTDVIDSILTMRDKSKTTVIKIEGRTVFSSRDLLNNRVETPKAQLDFIPGGIIRVFVYVPGKINQVEASLNAADGPRRAPVMCSELFPAEDGNQLYGVLPIAATVQEGPAVLKVAFNKAEEEPVLVTIHCNITKRVYPAENIYLNPVLTDIISKPDKRKLAESRELNALIQHVSTHTPAIETQVFMKPVKSDRVTSEYAHARRYIYSNGYVHMSSHSGVDYAAPAGTPVFAAGPGRVVMAKERIVTGNSIVIEHFPGVYSLYYHLDALGVEPGQRVLAGAPVGSAGSTGLSTGAHLHFGFHVHGIPCDPAFIYGERIIQFTR